MTKLRWIALFIWVSQAPATAVPGDINRDGKVDFADFFILADNFGKTGPPETDCEPIGGDEEPTVQDSVHVEQATNDSLNETSQDSEQMPPLAKSRDGSLFNQIFVDATFCVHPKLGHVYRMHDIQSSQDKSGFSVLRSRKSRASTKTPGHVSV